MVFSPDAENLLADLWNRCWTAVLSLRFEGGTGLTKVGFFSSVFETVRSSLPSLLFFLLVEFLKTKTPK